MGFVACLPANLTRWAQGGLRPYFMYSYFALLPRRSQQYKYTSIRILYFLIYFSAAVKHLSYNIVRALYTRVSPGRFQ